MSISVNHSDTDVGVVLVLLLRLAAILCKGVVDRTEYELSPSSEEPVAKIFGE